MTTTFDNRPNWTLMLEQAVGIPGRLSEAYRAFHNYSFGNQILAAIELSARGLPLAPIASFNRWKELGRSVKKGEKAIPLIMPVTMKRKAKEDAAPGDESGEAGTFTVFILKRNWFSLDQTDGEEYKPEVTTPGWDKDSTLRNLDIALIPFEYLDGNCQGYAVGRTVAVSPIAALPHKTLFHELAHVILGHTDCEATMSDAPNLPKCIMEAEAEATAYLCCGALDLTGMEEARGYIQSWLAGKEFPEKSARRVFSAADKILKAGACA